MIQLDELGPLIRQKRRAERLTLEKAAQQSGVSPATLWRLERRASAGASGRETPTPDVRTLGAVTDWLEVAIAGAGFAPAASPTARAVPEADSVPNVVEAHLRADRNLDSATATLLARMFRAAYLEFTGNSRGGPNQSEREDGLGKPEEENE